MGRINRHPDFPYADGDIIDGSKDLEVEFSRLYNEFNGRLDNDNFSASAAVAGSKFLDGSVPGSKFKRGTLETTALASAGEYDYDTTSDDMTDSTTLVDVPSVSSLSVTPSSVNDIIFCEFSGMYASASLSRAQYGWTFSVGGSDLGLLATSGVVANDSVDFVPITYIWAQRAATTSSVTVIARYLRLNGLSGDGSFADKSFSVRLLPG